MGKTLVILNDPPYGTERRYNALRLAGSLSTRDGEEVKVFLIGKAASCAKSHQKVPQGYCNVEVMLKTTASHGASIGVCGTRMDARGSLTATSRMVRSSTLDQLTGWTRWADKTLVF
jgi:uncharacterized protein involved in oxidation of intracellular sulfur